MTTIAIDGKYIACDGQVTSRNVIEPGRHEKIFQDEDGTIYAFSGCLPMFSAWVEWWKAGKNPKELPVAKDDYASMAFWVFKGGELWEIINEAPYPLKINMPSAIGSGREFALGAMFAGKSAKEAVEISSKLDTGTGGEIKVIELPAISLKAAE